MTTLKKKVKKNSLGFVHSQSENSLLDMSSPKPQESQGGYHCNIVQQPSKPLLIHCAVCTGILREPCQVTCCGQGFCKTCLGSIVVQGKPCPNCRVANYDGFFNENLQKELGKIEVHCTNQKEGCTWVGKLKRLEKHLNLEGNYDSTVYTTCQYANTKCPSCHKSVRRNDLALHTTERCIKRTYNCQYCGDYESTFEDVMTNHRPTCEFSPTQCPNDCGETLMYVDLGSHMDNDCLQKVLACEFTTFGCTAELPRRDMPTHLQERSCMHMSMFAKTLGNTVTRLELLQTDMRKELKKLREENCFLEQRIEKLAPGSAKSNKTPIVILSNRGPEDDREVLSSKDKTGSVDLLVAAEFTMSDYLRQKRENKEWFSPPFYTHQKGYRMCLEVLANGEGSRKGQCLAVYAYFMRGEFDSQLEWPFHGEIVIELVNQETGHSHSQTIHYTSATPTKFAECTVKAERSSFGKGIPDFIHVSELPKKFLKNDCLIFRVLRYRHSLK